MIEIVGKIEGKERRIAIVVSRFNEPITRKMLELAQETLIDHQVTTVWVPGAFEVPMVAKKLAKKFDAVICLGAVIRGETPHFDYVAGEAAAGIARTSLELEVPIIFGILTTDTATQALERQDKGIYAAKAALEMLDITDQIDSLALQSV